MTKELFNFRSLYSQVEVNFEKMSVVVNVRVELMTPISHLLSNLAQILGIPMLHLTTCYHFTALVCESVVATASHFRLYTCNLL